MYYTLVLAIHLILCLLLISLVLMQSGKGSAAGIFGASNSDSVFAGPTAATFITKLTAFIAAGIMVTAISLTVLSGKRGASSVVDNVKIPASAPKAPASK
jgi:preprotein translocase subunit SecG